MGKTYFDRYHWAALLFIILIAAALRLHNLGRAPLWLDEQCQLAAAQTSTIAECWTTGGQLGPIGHVSFFDTWFVWHAGGHSRAWLRLPAALWGIATIGMVYVLGRRWFSTSAGLFASALLAVSGVHIQFSREARGYALLVFLSVFWAWLLDRFVSRATWARGVWLFIVAELALQVHPAFVIVVASLAAAQYFSLWIEAKTTEGATPRNVAIAVGAILAATAVIFCLIPRELPISTTNKPLSDSLIYTLLDIYKTLLGGYWGIASYLIAILAVTGAIAGLRDKHARCGMLCALSVTLAGALPIIVGHWSGAAVFARYSLYALPFILLLPAYGLDTLMHWLSSKEPVRWVAAVALAAGLLVSMYIQGRSPYDLERFKESRPDWPKLDR